MAGLTMLALLLTLLSTSLGMAACACGRDIRCLERYAFDLVNRERSAAKLPLYTWNDKLANGGRAHSVLWLSVGNVCGIGHQCPGEADPGARITKAWGSPVSEWHEMVGMGNQYPTPNFDAIVVMIHKYFMSEGRGGKHYDIIMSPTSKYLGVGAAIDSNNLRITWDLVKP